MDLARANQKIAVIGGGPSGLAALKSLLSAGFDAELLEREDDFGGNWYYGKKCSSVYQSTHLISSKRLTEFTDFPMPAHWPHFISHRQALEYQRDYARHFQLYRAARFNCDVRRVYRGQNHWMVELAAGDPLRYQTLVVANGHNCDPRLPSFPGHFSGLSLHSSVYKTPEPLVGKRVLVVGAGNSGCDIAVESAAVAAHTAISMRRGYHFVPKFLRGKPIDECGERLLRWRIPLSLRRFVTRRMVKLALGAPQDFGLPAPDHRLFETHPIVNSQLLYAAGHGRIAPKPDVAELCGNEVAFADGTREPFDVIVYATGFNISIPFLDPSELNWIGGSPRLFLNVFHPQADDLFVIGLIQPDSGQWGLTDLQGQLVARFLSAVRDHSPRAEWFRRLKTRVDQPLGGGVKYVNSPRHTLEVEHFSYRRRLEKLIAQFR